jgi:hypothetical protein
MSAEAWKELFESTDRELGDCLAKLKEVEDANRTMQQAGRELIVESKRLRAEKAKERMSWVVRTQVGPKGPGPKGQQIFIFETQKLAERAVIRWALQVAALQGVNLVAENLRDFSVIWHEALGPGFAFDILKRVVRME